MYSSSCSASTRHWPRPPIWMAGRSPLRTRAYVWEEEIFSTSATSASVRNLLSPTALTFRTAPLRFAPVVYQQPQSGISRNPRRGYPQLVLRSGATVFFPEQVLHNDSNVLPRVGPPHPKNRWKRVETGVKQVDTGGKQVETGGTSDRDRTGARRGTSENRVGERGSMVRMFLALSGVVSAVPAVRHGVRYRVGQRVRHGDRHTVRARA